MSIADKQILLSRIDTLVSSDLNVNQKDKLMCIISQELSGFDVEYSEEKSANRTYEILDQFLQVKSIEGKSQNTIIRYKYVLTKLFEYLDTPIDDINVYHIRKYLGYLKEKGNSDVTIEGYRVIIHSFFVWCFNEQLLKSNSTANLGKVSCQKKLKYPFSDVEIEVMKENTETIRDKAIICFLLSTGCRISEMCQLHISDLDFKTNTVAVLGKGNKYRTLYFDEITSVMLQRYLKSREDKYQALFIGKGTPRITPHGVRFMLKNLEKITGIDNIHPHRFRRTFATKMINRGIGIEDVAKFLGHENIATTMKYVFISEQRMKENYNKFVG